MSEDAATAALSHPLVLKGAWLRIDAWYRSGNLAPLPELELWRLHPEAELRKLRDELRAGAWTPSAWRQLPYPKKGARLRHYVLPTVKDQVAFMAHMVLLGPLLDSCVANFAFGNRWYRPIVWNRRIQKPQWELRPYPLLTKNGYRPYARSHGLYRRVANWTIARMTGAQIRRRDYGGAIQHPEDYAHETLPPWVRKAWWGGEELKTRRAAWATLDIELAFPSVRLDRLMKSGINMLDHFDGPLSQLIIGYPHSVRRSMFAVECRQQVLRSLVEGLEQVEVDDDRIPRDAWRPCHAAPVLPPDNKGLPTGLAISGMLLNVALYDTDKSVREYLNGQFADHRSAFLRFADDMVLLSRSARGLMDLIDAVWRGLSGDGVAKLAVRKSQTNMYLGFEKISPEPVCDLVGRYLSDQGWKECKVAACGQVEPSEKPRDAVSLGQWWEGQQARNAEGGIVQLQRAVDQCMVGPGEVGPFVTTLVARLSDIANDTLSERFGEGARDRLIQLHDLARLDIDDLQVRADTRRAFAVNRLVRAWLPGGHEDVVTALSEIRRSIGHVLRLTPWKYSLWRGVVRAAARRPPNSIDKEEDNDVAATWLSLQLRRIAHQETEPTDASIMDAHLAGGKRR